MVLVKTLPAAGDFSLLNDVSDVEINIYLTQFKRGSSPKKLLQALQH